MCIGKQSSGADGEGDHGTQTPASDTQHNTAEPITDKMEKQPAPTSHTMDIDEPPPYQPPSKYGLTWLSTTITKGLEDFFELHGRRVAAHPYFAAAVCVLVSALCALGTFNFYTELRPYKLWLPQDSEFIKVLDWQSENFPKSYRRQLVFWEADNVLTARGIQEMWRLHQRIQDMTVGPNHTSWESVCTRVPSLPTGKNTEEKEPDYDYDYGTLQFRRRRDTSFSVEQDMSLSLSREAYCDIMGGLPKLCLETSLLEVWGLDEDIIMALTDEQVLEDVNNAQVSQVYGFSVNFTQYLGSIEYDEAGKIVSAGAATHMWVSHVDKLAFEEGDSVVDPGSGELVDTTGFAWEQAWLEVVLNTSGSGGMRAYPQAASSFGVVSDNNIWGDVKWLAIGFSVMCSFVNMALGRRNLVQQRPLLAFMGLFSIAQAIAVSYGVSSLIGIPYCPVNSILPILLMGLGVDDMFVIMAAWEAAGRDKSVTNMVERAGMTMRHAGVAITVTSLTDVTAFAVGASTDLPALRSFCVYAAVGIFAVYVLQATFFLAWLVQDEKRMEKHRNGMLWCVTHRDWTPWLCSQRDLLSDAFKHGFIPFILSTPMRMIIMLGTGALIATSFWFTMTLEQRFNPMWFIPKSSYLYESMETGTKHFPGAGEKGYIYFSNVSLPEDLPTLHGMVQELMDSDVVASIDPWFEALYKYMEQKPELANVTVTNSLLQDTLSIFLQSSSGASFRNDINIDGSLDCMNPAPPILSFRIGFKHRQAVTHREQLNALRTVQSVVTSTPLHGFKAAWAQAYSIWETNEIVGYEMWRNMGLAGLVVGIVTLILLASFGSSMAVVLCVAGTVVGVSGTMAVWGLTIDTVSCVALVLAIGLSVDYAAHVAHAFLMCRGTKSREQRVREAMELVGPAVFLGGFSTFLSFVLLAGSTSHVFITFFKVFTAASVLGLYYGIVFLPVLLSFVGPEPYLDREDDSLTITPPPHNEEFAFTNNAFTSDNTTT